MTLANVIMLGLGLASLVGGAILLLRRGESDASVYVRRIAGTMLGALGIVLIIFAFGLSTIEAAPDA